MKADLRSFLYRSVTLNLNHFLTTQVWHLSWNLRTGFLGSDLRYTSRIVFDRMSQKSQCLHAIYFLHFFNLMVSAKSFLTCKVCSVLESDVLQISAHLCYF